MTARYRSWLVVQESANADLQSLVVSLGLSSTLDVTARPVVTLTMRGNTAVLSTPDVRGLFEQIYQADTLRKPLLAFATAPAEDLRRMHGRVFLGSVFHARLGCRAASVPAESDDPYFRRIVELRFLASQTQETLDTSGTAVEPSASPDGHPLFVNPLRLTVESGRLARLMSDGARALQAINGSVLPPVRDDLEGTYFADALRTARGALAQHVGAVQPTARQPAAIALWRSVDDPLLRDVLIDGGSIEVTHADGEPTLPSLSVWGLGSTDDPLAAYRARTLLQPERAIGGGIAPSIARAIAGDFTDTLPCGLATRPARAPVSWDATGVPREFDRGSAREGGSWQRFEALWKELELRASSKATGAIWDRVLQPSRPRPGLFADHDLAEVEFIRHLWRTPWSVAPDRAWRWALIDALKTEFTGTFPSVDERVASWASRGHFALRRTPGAAEIVYPANAAPEEVLRWRLTVPFGIVFKPNAQMRIDDGFSKLDRGYQLA